MKKSRPQFISTPDEQKLYDLVSGYLQREHLYALPSSQRQLITLILRKLLASSTFAIAKTLHSLVNRLQLFVKEEENETLTQEQIEEIKSEIQDLESSRDLAESIT